MKDLFKAKLRQETTINSSGVVLSYSSIPVLKEKNYYVIPQGLDGDAPKEFIAAYIYSKDNNFVKKNIKSWNRYIAKTAEKWYPVESITEYTINQLGEVLGVKMNVSKLVIGNGQIRFLSEYFLNKNELLIHGAEICGDYLNDRAFAEAIANDRVSARELFTFELIAKALDNRFKSHSLEIKKELVKMIVFDSLLGNNDRHFYNWGVITNTKKTIKKPIFAPVYDSARGLFWNLSDENIVDIYNKKQTGNSKRVQNYAKKASPRISCENNKEANHFELVGYLKSCDKEYLKIANNLSSKEMEKKVISEFRRNYSKFFIKERQLLIEELISIRFEQTRKA
jgi:hypothetical protein